MASAPVDPGKAGLWVKSERERRAWSGADMARLVNGFAKAAGDTTVVSQQVISKFEQGNTKRMPHWLRYVVEAFDDANALLPNFAGMGAGGSDEGDPGVVSFSRDLIERELRAPANSLLAMVAEGNSMEPEFRGGDQILVDTRRKSLAQPGAFCLWDGDGHVIKFLEKVPDSDPPKVRVISLNPLYQPHERLIEEINLVGRVVWFGRKIQ
jgi:hypothetical protein